MLTNKFYQPSLRVSEYVSRYLIAEDSSSLVQENQVVCIYPNGLNALGFTYGSSTRHRTAAGETRQINKGCFVMGTQEKVFYMLPSANLKQFVIIFRPGVLSKLLRTNLAEIKNNIFEIGGFIREEESICEQLAEAYNHQQQIEIIENWILKRLQPDHICNDLTQHIIHEIHRKAGDIKVQEICRTNRINERYLERKFSELVGVSPKKYADIIRFNFLLNIISGYKPKVWKEAYEEAGLNDYSHLSKQVQKFAGLHPRSLKEKLTHRESVLYTEAMNEPFNRVNMLRTVE